MIHHAELYRQDAEHLRRLISDYSGLTTDLLCGFLPERADKIPSLLKRMESDGQLFQSGGRWFLHADAAQRFDLSVSKAVLVLQDFLAQVEHHIPGEHPTQIVFFSQGEMYEIICVPSGQETVLSLLLHQNLKTAGRRLVILDSTEQIQKLSIPCLAAYCLIQPDGTITYYKEAERDSKTD